MLFSIAAVYGSVVIVAAHDYFDAGKKKRLKILIYSIYFYNRNWNT